MRREARAGKRRVRADIGWGQVTRTGVQRGGQCRPGGGEGMKGFVLAAAAVVALAAPAQGLEIWNSVVLNEVHYYMPGFDAENEYIEIMNMGGTVSFLDGAVITDEGDDGMPEPVFRFPGAPGGFEHPIWPGEILLIAVDAIAGEIEPDLSHADWEFVHPSDDNDNPDVPNLIHCSGSDIDLALANAGDGILLATGADTTAAVDCATVVDGVNWDGVIDPVPIVWTVCTDPAFADGSPQGNSIGRCPGAVDRNTSSAADWVMMIPTPGEPNMPSYPSDCSTGIAARPASWGMIKALYR